MSEFIIALVGVAGALFGVIVGAWVQRREIRREWIRTQRFTAYAELDKKIRTLIVESDKSFQLLSSAGACIGEARTHRKRANNAMVEATKVEELELESRAMADALRLSGESVSPATTAKRQLEELILDLGKISLLFSPRVIDKFVEVLDIG